MKLLRLVADALFARSFALALSLWRPGLSFLPPIRPRKRNRLTPFLPTSVKEPFRGTHLRPRRRWTVNLTDPGSESEKLTLVPIGGLAALIEAPELAALNLSAERRSTVIVGSVVSGAGVGVTVGVGAAGGAGVTVGVG